MSASAVVSQCQDGLCRAKRFAVYHELEKVAKNSTNASARPSNPRSGSALILEYACDEIQGFGVSWQTRSLATEQPIVGFSYMR